MCVFDSQVSISFVSPVNRESITLNHVNESFVTRAEELSIQVEWKKRSSQLQKESRLKIFRLELETN